MSETVKQKRAAYKKYSVEFKDHAIVRAKQSGVSQAARDLGISESLIYTWRAKSKQGNGTLEQQKLQHAELAQLKRDNQRLARENEFLKKAAAYFAEESKRGTE